MNLFTRTFSKIFKSGNQQELDKIKPIIDAINKNEDQLKNLKENDFKEKTYKFKKYLKEGNSLDKILPETFALVREAAKRVLGERDTMMFN